MPRTCAGAPVYAARQIDGDDRQAGPVDRRDGLRGNPFHRPVEARAKQRVDDQVGVLDNAGRQSFARSRPGRRGERCVALQPVARGQQSDRHRVAGLLQQPRRHETVAAIVAGTGHDRHAAALREQIVDRFGDRHAGGLHQGNPRRSGADGELVGPPHLLRCQNFDGISEQPDLAGLAFTVVATGNQQVFEGRRPL